MTGRAVFLDKDGTLIENVPHNVDPAYIRLAPGASEGLRQLSELGFSLFVVSNQPGVGLGYFDHAALDRVWQRLNELVAPSGVTFAGYYHCPHHPWAAIRQYAMVCECRKPAPGMLLTAAREHRIELHESWMIGDILDDVEAGVRAGCQTILLDVGNETQWRTGIFRKPACVVKDITQAAAYIEHSIRAPANQTAFVQQQL